MSQETVLVIDDEEVMRDILETLLARQGYDVRLASSGAEGLELARAVAFDAAIVDIMMPGLAGPEVRTQLVNEPATKNIPIIFLTGLRAPHSTKKPFIDGVKVIGKAKDFNELLEAIREVLGNKNKV